MFGGIVVVVLVLLARGAWHPAKAMELTDRDRQKRWATQADIEEREVGEMVEGQNEYRRARGERELTEADAQALADERQRASIERSRPAG